VPTNLADWLSGQDAERMLRYRELLDFYEGNQWARRRRANETRLTFNYARSLVRKVASNVFSKPVTFAVAAGDGELSESVAAEAERVLNDLYATQELHALDFQTLVDSSVLGDGAFKVIWDPSLCSGQAQAGAPPVAAVDLAGLWAFAKPDNVREVVRVLQRYTLPAWQAEQLFDVGLGVAAQGAVRVVEDWTRDRVQIEVAWKIVRDEPNLYGWIPYVIFPNVSRPHEIWGESDLTDLLDVCRELNRRMTVISCILQVSGNPIVVLENVAGADGIRADEGAVWELPEDSKAYLLDMLQGGGVKLRIEYVELLYRVLHDLAETPRTTFGDSGRALSDAALEVEVQPLVQKVQRKRRAWEAVYQRRNAMLLDLLERFGGLQLGGAQRTQVLWAEVLPSDFESLVRAEAQLVNTQIHSRRTAMQALGSEDAESEWATILEEQAALTPSPSPNAGRGKPEEGR
jgi:Phage portal protein, SPP1 Gp6-like